jgi:hypothetical protein
VGVVASGVDGPVDGALGDFLFRRSVLAVSVVLSWARRSFGYCVAFGDDRSGLVDGYWSAVDVTELVWLSGTPAGDDSGQERGGDVA